MSTISYCKTKYIDTLIKLLLHSANTSVKMYTLAKILAEFFSLFLRNFLQGHPTDRFGGISVRKICNRLKFSVREMSSRAFLINAFCFRRDKNDVLGTKIGQLGFSERQ